jgi:hypothetical protein
MPVHARAVVVAVMATEEVAHVKLYLGIINI